MELCYLQPGQEEMYLDFYRMCWRNRPQARDIMSSTLAKILRGKAQINRGTRLWPYLVRSQNQTVAVALLAKVDRLPEYLQLCYFEALPGQQGAVDLLLRQGIKIAREESIPQLLIGLNLHVNYGLGLLASDFDAPQSFGSAFNPSYYLDYFTPWATETVALLSYLTSLKNFSFNLSDKVMERMTRRFSVRQANFAHLKAEAELYTTLNNLAFASHPFYYQRRTAEDLELFREFRPFLKEENLLFLETDGQPIGFMLWYPDFNQVMHAKETIGLGSLLKAKLFASQIRRFKIVELGVIPEFQNSGGVLALFQRCLALTSHRFQECESGWILASNRASAGFGTRWAQEEYKKYHLYLVDVIKGQEKSIGKG